MNFDNLHAGDPYSVSQFLRNGTDASAKTVSSSPATVLDENNWLEYAKKRAATGDEAAIDQLMNWFMSEESAKTARNWEHERNKNAVPELVEGLKKAGINPYWLDSLGGAPNYSSSGIKYSSGSYLSQSRAEETERNNRYENLLGGIGKIISAIALMAFIAG